MKICRLDCSVYIEVEDEVDPEDLASDFNLGFEQVVTGYPEGDVVQARVNEISIPAQEELEEKGLVE